MKHQVSALPYRYSDGPAGLIEVLLITSSNGRWIIPKGDVDGDMEPHLAAEKEAFEEGGVRGQIWDRPIGAFRTCKDLDGTVVPIEVDVFPLVVDDELYRWPEMEVRKRRWYSQSAAANAVQEPELSKLIRSFWPG